MRSSRRLLPLVGLLGVFAAMASTALAVTVSWGRASEVPGTAALNVGGNAGVASVSCGVSAGNCAAGGSYKDGSGKVQAFVVAETGGAWGQAMKVPGMATLNRGGRAFVSAISCVSAGNCAAGGEYKDYSGKVQPFLVSEKSGSWVKAIEVPGFAALGRSGFAFAPTTTISCASAGNCAAGGSYKDRSGKVQVFVVAEKKGVWGKAIEVPGTAVLNRGGLAQLDSVSCASAGNCAAVGSYTNPSPGSNQAFVVNEERSVWGKAIKVPGTATLNRGDEGFALSVSCPSAGNCAAGGSYADKSGKWQAFVVGEKRGVWGKAIEVPGTAILNHAGGAGVNSVSCVSAGNCAAGGDYDCGNGWGCQAFVVTETSGVWGKAREVPGTASLNAGGDAGVSSVSCVSAGNCAAGGYYEDSVGTSNRYQAFIVAEKSGVWGNAIEAPGTAALNVGNNAGVASISCTSAGRCAVGGGYADDSGKAQAFLTAP